MTHFRWFQIVPLVVVLGRAAVCRASFDEFADGRSPTNFQICSSARCNRARSGGAPLGCGAERAKCDRALTLTLKGELELELHDLQGEGGVEHDSVTDTRTLGTRSPYVEIDSFWLAFRLGLPPHLAVNSVVELTPDGARVGAAWFDGRFTGPAWLEHHLELGLHTALVKTDRRTERYPLIATIYWREPEFHLAYEGRARPGRRTVLELGLSLAMMRPLAFAAVQDSTRQPGTINVLAYGAARTFSGNGPVGGGKLLLGSHGAHVMGFGFVGRLSAEAGTDELRASLAGFQDLPGFNADEVSRQDSTFYWVGGRMGYNGHGLHLLAEGIVSRESLLRRYGVYVQLSHAFRLRRPHQLLHTIELLGRYEIYRLMHSQEVGPRGRALRSVAPSQAATWDFSITTAATTLVLYREMLRLRLEYCWIREANGVPALAIADAPVRNDELLLQLELRF